MKNNFFKSKIFIEIFIHFSEKKVIFFHKNLAVITNFKQKTNTFNFQMKFHGELKLVHVRQTVEGDLKMYTNKNIRHVQFSTGKI